MASQSIVEVHFGVPCNSSNEQWPVSEVADVLQKYCEQIAARNLRAGPKRRATGPRDLAYLMLRQVYEAIFRLQCISSERIVFKILKAARLEVAFRECNCELIDDKKLSAWASACESLLNMGVRPAEFSETLQKYKGLEGLRKNRFVGLDDPT